jgi:hypothetical protein
MEDKSSFYEFLAANSKLTKEETKKVHPFYLLLSWVTIFMTNSLIVWVGWNYAVAPILSTTPVTFVQSILLYSIAKIFSRGFFSVQ